MYILILSLIIIAAVLLVLVVLAQNSKGGGLSSTFGQANQMMGVKKTTDLLEKTTWVLLVFIVAMALVSANFIEKGESTVKSTNVEAAQDQAAPSAAPQSNEIIVPGDSAE
ncbi:preprotein translocase subunit SecG [Marinigracilibium pacificum]|uniref:Protein-export membrane protein SecG n=1 Tax=Marinigracilibium pacificum TaxID=2729599 RepID=A0A848J0W8_9BACT|nr:preprotein translocase subunit SecG [Marinigracilibium pacificum]NMM49311.1 preprotein translocase subunit SecG [Marinigracilibium pacificum]